MSEDTYDELKKQISEIHKALLGDFDNQGIITRLRKLEERAGTHNKIMIAIGTAVLSLIVNAVRMLLGI